MKRRANQAQLNVDMGAVIEQIILEHDGNFTHRQIQEEMEEFGIILSYSTVFGYLKQLGVRA